MTHKLGHPGEEKSSFRRWMMYGAGGDHREEGPLVAPWRVGPALGDGDRRLMLVAVQDHLCSPSSGVVEQLRGVGESADAFAEGRHGATDP